MARPKRIAGEIDTTAKILNAARLEFAENGLAARLEDIGARCGVSRASILHHYESKQVLLDAVFQQAADKARIAIIAAAQATQGHYPATIRGVTLTIRQIEQEEHGTAAVVLQALLTKPVSQKLKGLLQDLLALITQLAIQAGADRYHSPELLHATIAHVIMGELSRLALGAQAQDYWGSADPILPLIDNFFQLP